MTARPENTRVGEFVGGKYRIIRVLAEGGMGIVYEAQHAVVGRRFAVKFLRPDLTGRREIMTRFHREAQAAGALESENIAAVIDFGILGDGTPYIVMEYLVGESLRSLLAREGRLPVERATDLCLQACRGMEAAHASGIIHRDLKPENLFVCRRQDGTDMVKVLDFGIAKLKQIELDNAATRTGAILGTPAYMSPEQARGDKTIDHRTDIYGLGALLFEMLSGEKPHPGDSHNAILHHISTQPAVSLRAIRPDLPEPLLDAIERALACDPNQRPTTAGAFGQSVAPFAARTVWPPARTGDPASSGEATFTTLHGRMPEVSGVPAREAEVDVHGMDVGDVGMEVESTASPQGRASPSRRRPRTQIALACGVVAAAAIAMAVGSRERRPSPNVPPRKMGERALPSDSRFFVPAPMPGAISQIAALVKQRAFSDAAPLTAMEATPQAVWFMGGTPDEVRSAVQNIIIRAAPDRRVPVLVASNIPFRDCAQYSAGGASSAAAYQAWIDGFAGGIGNGRAVVILEPDSLGIMPYGSSLDGAPDWCKPTVADAEGRTIRAPGATPAERYAALNHAVDSLATRAPNASVYLDGTHAGWLGVGEIAHRLVSAGVRRAQGFFVNVDNTWPTPQSIQYGTWISKCIYYAREAPIGGRPMGRHADCASQYSPANVDDHATWGRTEKWYVDNVDHGPSPPAGPSALTHFVIDTSRNGRGVLDTAPFATAPYDQPPEVIQALRAGSWCNPPGAGVGLRPTADTGVPLVDALLWVKVPGGSDGSCDIAGGARAWDYARHNPWGIGGDAQHHFDPLWGTVDPAAGEWFAEQALQLAQNADPPLQASGPSERPGRSAISAGIIEPTAKAVGTQPMPARQEAANASAKVMAMVKPSASGISLGNPSGRLPGRPGGRPGSAGAESRAAASIEARSGSAPSAGVVAPHPASVVFDPKNPYGD